MKENVSPAVMAAIIVVVVALIAFFGYKTINGNHSSGPTRDDMRKQMMAHPTYPGMTAPGSMPTPPGGPGDNSHTGGAHPTGGGSPTSGGYPYGGVPGSGG